MAYTNINPTRTTHTGIAVTPTNGDESNGNKCANDGKMILLLENTNGSNSATVTIATPKTVNGLAVADNAITLAANQIKIAGPFPPELYNQAAGDTDAGCVRWTYSGTAAADVYATPIQV